MKDKFDYGNYKYCPDCWRPYPDVEFYSDGPGWQYSIRCVDCEDKYISDYLKKYPNTSKKFKFRKLTDDEYKKHQLMLDIERRFLEREETVNGYVSITKY